MLFRSARTSTMALTNATSPCILKIANKGVHQSLRDDQHFLDDLNVYQGRITCEAVARAQGLEFVDPKHIFH